jgi:hypothetical protein
VTFIEILEIEQRHGRYTQDVRAARTCERESEKSLQKIAAHQRQNVPSCSETTPIPVVVDVAQCILVAGLIFCMLHMPVVQSRVVMQHRDVVPCWSSPISSSSCGPIRRSQGCHDSSVVQR